MRNEPQHHHRRIGQRHAVGTIGQPDEVRGDAKRGKHQRNIEASSLQTARHHQPSQRIDDAKKQNRRRQQSKDHRCIYPLRAQHDTNNVVSEHSREQRNRRRQGYDKRVPLKKIILITHGVMLQARQRGKRYAANRRIQLGRWNVDELTGTRVKSKYIGTPKAPQQDLVEIIGNIDDKSRSRSRYRQISAWKQPRRSGGATQVSTERPATSGRYWQPQRQSQTRPATNTQSLPQP